MNAFCFLLRKRLQPVFGLQAFVYDAASLNPQGKKGSGPLEVDRTCVEFSIMHFSPCSDDRPGVETDR